MLARKRVRICFHMCLREARVPALVKERGGVGSKYGLFITSALSCTHLLKHQSALLAFHAWAGLMAACASSCSRFYLASPALGVPPPPWRPHHPLNTTCHPSATDRAHACGCSAGAREDVCRQQAAAPGRGRAGPGGTAAAAAAAAGRARGFSSVCGRQAR